MDATCKTCPFWRETEEEDCDQGSGFADGECRRNSPPVSDNYTSRLFPEINAAGWCGEHPARQRDRLAAMAMVPIIQVSDAVRDEELGLLARTVAKQAYEFADAMLELAGRR